VLDVDVSVVTPGVVSAVLDETVFLDVIVEYIVVPVVDSSEVVPYVDELEVPLSGELEITVVPELAVDSVVDGPFGVVP
jgi:hypothetical protein